MTYRRYPAKAPRSSALVLIVVLVALVVVMAARSATAEPVHATYQGKDASWWAHRAQQARRDANARRATIRRLRRTLNYSPTIQEAVQLATIAYPDFSSSRAWQIIRHESWMTSDPARAKNPASTASGLYQFLTSTFASTPYGHLSIWSPYAQSLAAGWMHEHGRGCEWQIGATC